MKTANRAPYRLALAALDVGERDDVLELGFGPGAGLSALAQATAGMVCGLDHSPTMQRLARRRNRSAIAEGRMQLCSGSIGELPWPDHSFDRILMVNVVYFLDPDGREMSEVRRVLRSGGRLAVYATDRSTMRSWPFAQPDTHCAVDADDLR